MDALLKAACFIAYSFKSPHDYKKSRRTDGSVLRDLERVKGIEPSCSAWEAERNHEIPKRIRLFDLSLTCLL